MPQRGNGGTGDGSEGQEPEYNWLYGKQRDNPHRGSEDPEPTRMLPKIERSSGAADAPRSRSTRPAQQPSAPRSAPRNAPRSAPPGRPRRRFRGGRLVLLVLVAWVAFLVAVPIWASSKIEKVDIEPAGARPGSQPGNTYLLVGSDSRKGLSRAGEQAARHGRRR